MHTSIALLLELGIVLIVLGAVGTVTRRFGVSPIPLYLLVGLAVGEGGIAPLPAARDFVEIGASIGVVLLLLTLGLEFSIEEFTVTLRQHVPSGLADMVVNAAPGALAGWLLGLDATGIVALAGVTWVSSSTIVSRLLDDLHRLGNRETPAVLSVLLLEDFAMAVYLPILAVLATGGTALHGVASVAVAVGVLLLALIVSRRWGHRVGHLVEDRDTEQLLLRIVGLALVVAAIAELAGTSAAVGAFLVGLALTGPLADRVRSVVAPLRDLFAAAFFLAIGISVPPASLLPLLPLAAALAAVTALTKIGTGWYAAARGGAGRRGRLRAGTVLIVRGEFSIVIVGLVATQDVLVGPLTTGYVLLLAVAGPLITWWFGNPARQTS
ncbi:cation:proton antiporter [Saccharopolyspora phatthalungensis]|uniref:CPA2 family monovalent cation:H+ antiporter-2 n=1 Tax=Saccharopolyspora phatthalungensis TaxID=664693 RepID=A0A840QDV5_9PSEU|nr:cation:proton antiporter [Saccharopolyspora phatthalungensis]MBB5156749.1 CPA2 family monovalent cation:H+ antiporter-2 [Saccharopolyspora phatthalungensis]